jgi:hypothetical protein
MFNTSRYIDHALGGRSTGNYAAYFLADQQLVQLAPIVGEAARGVYAGVTAMYTPPEFNRFSQYYELRLYGIGLALVLGIRIIPRLWFIRHGPGVLSISWPTSPHSGRALLRLT